MHLSSDNWSQPAVSDRFRGGQPCKNGPALFGILVCDMLQLHDCSIFPGFHQSTIVNGGRGHAVRALFGSQWASFACDSDGAPGYGGVGRKMNGLKKSCISTESDNETVDDPSLKRIRSG